MPRIYYYSLSPDPADHTFLATVMQGLHTPHLPRHPYEGGSRKFEVGRL